MNTMKSTRIKLRRRWGWIAMFLSLGRKLGGVRQERDPARARPKLQFSGHCGGIQTTRANSELFSLEFPPIGSHASSLKRQLSAWQVPCCPEMSRSRLGLVSKAKSFRASISVLPGRNGRSKRCLSFQLCTTKKLRCVDRGDWSDLGFWSNTWIAGGNAGSL